MYAWLCKGRPGATRAGAGPGDLDDGWSEVEAAGGTNGLPLAGAGGPDGAKITLKSRPLKGHQGAVDDRV